MKREAGDGSGGDERARRQPALRSPMRGGVRWKAWQRIPAALRHRIAELAAVAGCADELRHVTGAAAVLRSKDDK
jgi:hypothetical protein